MFGSFQLGSLEQFLKAGHGLSRQYGLSDKFGCRIASADYCFFRHARSRIFLGGLIFLHGQ
jgi:hypothetical protein